MVAEVTLCACRKTDFPILPRTPRFGFGPVTWILTNGMWEEVDLSTPSPVALEAEIQTPQMVELCRKVTPESPVGGGQPHEKEA